MCVLESISTHDRGGARDGGALSIHITNFQPSGTVHVCDRIHSCRFDHHLTYVHVHDRSSTGVRIRPTQDRRGVYVTRWARDVTEWSKAIAHTAPLAHDLASCYHDVVVNAVAMPPNKFARRSLATSTLVIFDMVLCVAGHAAGLLAGQTQPSTTQERKDTHATAAHLLKSARAAQASSHNAANKVPRSAVARQAADVQNLWLTLTVNSRTALKRPLLDSSWVVAARAGDQALQKWLTSKATLKPPRLPTASEADAAEVVRFRAEVSQLDARCDEVAEQSAAKWMKTEFGRRCSRFSMPAERPTVAAMDEDALATNLVPPHFFTTATVARLIRRRRASKSSSQLPWAALRAGSYDVAWLLLIHSTLEIAWAVADIDDSSLCIEIAHMHKGKGKPVAPVKSYRPLGLAHPLTSLRSDILRLR